MRPVRGERRIEGVLFEVSESDVIRLAEVIEGPSYEFKEVKVRDAAGELKAAMIFVVKIKRRRSGLWTSAEYVRHIVASLRFHGVPEDYVQYDIATALQTNGHTEINAVEQIPLIKAL